MSKHFLKYPKKNISTARMLRKNMTEAEKILWSHLRNNGLGVKFRRQVPFGPYILDFFSINCKLNIELDGSQHYTADGIQNDKLRDQYLEKMGVSILRFSTTEFLENTDAVIDEIFENVQEKPEKEQTKRQK